MGIDKNLALHLVAARARTPVGNELLAGIQTGQGELPIVLFPQRTFGDITHLAAHQAYPLDVRGRGMSDNGVWRIFVTRSVNTGTSQITVMLWGSLVDIGTGALSSRGRRKSASPDRTPPHD